MYDLTEAAAYYKKQGAPGDQTALLNFLREVQSEHGGSIPAHLPAEMARLLGTKETLLLALIRRIPSLQLSGKPVLEICGGPRCRGAAMAEALQKRYPQVEVRLVGCMRLCAKGPNVKLNGKLYHNADEALLKQLLE